MPGSEKIGAGAAGTVKAFRYLAGKAGSSRTRDCRPEDIRNVLVRNSASRSGSSVLYRLLSARPGVISLNGEDALFQKLHGLFGLESSSDSDEFPAAGKPPRAAVEGAAMDMLLDSGREWRPGLPFPAEDYAGDCARRFLLQWSGSGADPDRVLALASAAVGEELSRGPGFDHVRCWAAFLSAAAGFWPGVDEGYCDLPGKIRAVDTAADGPPEGTLLEEPPFVVPAPRVFPAHGEARGMTLLLKSSSNCYRMALLKRFFPAARYRFILLTRNPLGAVNGLMDGWLSRGFFSRDVGAIAPLSIAGYSSPERPWSRRWWKFDLPPGWAALAGRPLAEVCAFQWTSANSRILKDSAAGVFGGSLRLRYEDLLDAAGLGRSVAMAAEFAGLDTGGPDPVLAAARPVMSVTPPRRGKWLARRTTLAPLLAGPAGETAAALGYDKKEMEKWP